nr:transcriptional regulatory protein LnrK-like [Nerophis lumbriciformis]
MKGAGAQPTRVLVVHCSPLVAGALTAALGTRDNLQVAAAHGPRWQGEPAAGSPDVVLIDALGGLQQAREAARWTRRHNPQAKVVALGIERDREALALIEEGACGHLPKSADLADLHQVLDDVLDHRPPCSPRLAASVLRRITELAEKLPSTTEEKPAVRLTPREDQVLRLLGNGLLNKEIARQLGISLPTVKNHVHKILDKLSVEGRRQAIRRAVELGLLPQMAPGWLAEEA